LPFEAQGLYSGRRAKKGPKASDAIPDDWADILARLREDRQTVASLQHVPAEALSHLDSAIDILANAAPLAAVGLHDKPNEIRENWINIHYRGHGGG
jgi:hypothetical protein